MKTPDGEEIDRLQEEETAPYAERRIESLEELATFIQAMDQDEGVRIRGEVEGFKGGGYIFVAKSENRYCINICDRVLDPARKTYTVGENDVWLYLDSFEETWERLKKLVRNPIEAYAY